jgi:hypothetical protein
MKLRVGSTSIERNHSPSAFKEYLRRCDIRYKSRSDTGIQRVISICRIKKNISLGEEAINDSG